MNAHHVRRLPVVDEDGRIIGVVSRRDLLSVFLRPDGEIAADIREIFAEILPADPQAVTVTVHNGLVTLTGIPGRQDDQDLLPVAIRLARSVDGVVDVRDKLGEPAQDRPAAPRATTAPPSANGTHAAG
jgi:CBS domain-containing protein